VEGCLEQLDLVKNPQLEDYINTDKETRIKALELVN